MGERHIVIAIGREFGSAGKEIGLKLADRLGVKCYDNSLLKIVAKNSGFCEEFVEANDEKPNNSLLFSLVADNAYATGAYHNTSFVELPMNHKVFLAQFEAIKALAEKESCVIIGRCADYALAGNPNCVSVFINADMEFRMNYLRNNPNFTETFKDDNKFRDYINKQDRRRANYYNYYSNKKWADSRSYDLCINSAKIGIDEAVNLIDAYVKHRFAE